MYEYTKADIPVAPSRAKAVNPHVEAGIFPSDELAVVFNVPTDEVAKTKRLLRSAATLVDRTAKVKTAPVVVGVGKNRREETEITTWTVPRITRKNGDADGSAS